MAIEDLEDAQIQKEVRDILIKVEQLIKKGKDPMVQWIKAKRKIQNICISRQAMRNKLRGKTLKSLMMSVKKVKQRDDFLQDEQAQKLSLALDEEIAMIEASKRKRAAESSAA
ncbi:hypothetical protein FRB95_004346, partial [Tulasnella sp. JGI-2019a]